MGLNGTEGRPGREKDSCGFHVRCHTSVTASSAVTGHGHAGVQRASSPGPVSIVEHAAFCFCGAVYSSPRSLSTTGLCTQHRCPSAVYWAHFTAGRSAPLSGLQEGQPESGASFGALESTSLLLLTPFGH